MSAPLLSLCMIVRNEEAMLSECLKSVAGLADELVVVDTGSTDATVAVAQGFGARVLHADWQDDFSAPRNLGLQAAQGQWILVLDADDRLEAADRPAVAALLAQPTHDAYWFRTISYVGDRPGGSSITCPHIRLFRNAPEIRYHGRIHEWPKLPPDYRLGRGAVRIYHLGYLNHLVAHQAKARRNLRILQAIEAEKPDDAFTLYNLGTEWIRLGDWDQAIDVLTRSLQIVEQTDGWAPDVVKKLAVALMSRRRHDEALQVLTRGLQRYPDYTDLQYLLACLYHRVRRYPSALAAYRRCLELGEAPFLYATDDGAGSFQALFGYGLVHRDLGNHAEAVAAFLATLEQRVDYTAPLPPLLGCLLEWRGKQGTLAFLAERIELSPPIYRKLASAALEGAHYDLALTLQRLAGRPWSAADQLLRGHCCLGRGQLARAEAEWRAVPAAAPEHAEAQRHLELVRWLADPAAPSPLPPDADSEQRLNLAAKLLECGQAERVEPVLQPLLAAGRETRLEAVQTFVRLGAPERALDWAGAAFGDDLTGAERQQLREIEAGAALAAGRWSEALRLFRQLLEQDPWCYPAYVGWTRALLAQSSRLCPALGKRLHPSTRPDAPAGTLQLWKWREPNARRDRPVRHRPQ